MRTTTTRRPAETLAEIQQEIQETATRIVDRQRRQATLITVDIPKVRGEVAAIDQWLSISDAQTAWPPSEKAAQGRRDKTALAAKLGGLCDEERDVAAELTALHQALDDLHGRRRAREIVGTRARSLPDVSDWRDDAQLLELAGHDARLQQQLAAATAAVAGIAAEIVDAETRARTARVQLHLGKGKKADLESLEQQAEALRRRLAAANGNLEELREASDDVAARRAARETAVREQRVPVLLAQYRSHFADFVERLIDAAIAAERAEVFAGALINAGADESQIMRPWHELALVDPASRLVAYIALARERGFIGQPRQVTAA